MRGGLRRIRVAVSIVATALSAGLFQTQARGDVTKANNTDALNIGSSYVGNATPLATDKINFDSTLSGPGPLAYSIGDNLTVNGLNFTTFVGAQTINGVATKKLTIGAGGIVSTNVTDDITINADLNLSASQSFVLPNAARTLTLNGVISSAASVNLTIGGSTAANTAIYFLVTPGAWTGTTKINTGLLRMGGVNVLPATTVVNVAAPSGQTANFQLNGFSQTIAGLDNSGAGTRKVTNGIGGTPPALTLNVPTGTTQTYGSALGTSGNANDNNYSLVKIGGGLQELSAQANVFLTGGITITDGALGFQLANAGATSNLTLNGGVFQNFNANGSPFTRALGTGASQMQMTANGGGFSAKTAQLIVNIGGLGTPAAADWLDAPGAGLVGPLKFGHESSNFDVLFQNPINVNGAMRTIDVADDTASTADFATMAGVIADGSAAGGITKTGAGTLFFSAANTYTGGTAVNGGVLEAATPGVVPTTNITVNGSGILAVKTSTFSNAQADALRTAATYTAGGGFGYDVASGSFTPSAGISGNVKICKLGAGDMLLNAPNTHTGGTSVLAGRLLIADPAGLGTGTLTVAGGATVASDGATPRTISVPMTVTGAAIFGNATTETGALTFTQTVNMNGAPRNLTFLVPTTFAAGWLNDGLSQKLGASTFTLDGTSTRNGVVEVRDGTFVLAATGTVTATDGIRVMSTVSSGTARMEIRGTYTINTTTGNIRIGHESANGTGVTATQDNILDIYGTMQFTGFTTGGATQLGSDSVHATVNIFPGGLLVTKQIANSANDFGTAITTINIDGGTIRALESRTTYMSGLTGGAFIRAGGATIDTNGFDITIGQNMQHDAALGATVDGGLKKSGAGILTLTGTTNNYTGATTVQAGTLQVNTTNGTGTGAVLVKSGATLGGTGSIAGPITLEAGAKLAPGASAGTLTVGTLTLDAAVNGVGAGALVFEIGSTSDKVIGSSISYGVGELDLGDFTFSSLAGIAPGNYTLLTGVTAGNLGPNTTASNVAGLSGYDAQLSQNSGDVVLTLTGVPEPGTAGVIGAGMLGLLARRRRRSSMCP
jgi:autotransporter-associated beta strand protein